MKKPIAPSQPTKIPSSQPTKSHESSLIDPDRDRDAEELATIAMNGAVRMLQASSQLVARAQTAANDISALLKEGI